MKTRVPILITAFVGVFMILKYFFTAKIVADIANELEQWGVVTLAFAIVLGVLNMAKINLKTVMERKKDWGYKLVLLISMVAMFTVCVFKWQHDQKVSDAETLLKACVADASKLPAGKTLAQLEAETTQIQDATKTTPFQFAFDRIYTPLAATIFSLLAFYVASAAFRAFRARNFHSSLLLGAAVVVMIGRVPIGGAIWKWFPYIQDWVMIWPNTAGQRAILMGAAIGMIAMGLRIIFGIERPYLKG